MRTWLILPLACLSATALAIGFGDPISDLPFHASNTNSTAAASFDPSQISGLIARYEASQFTGTLSIGQQVDTWTNQVDGQYNLTNHLSTHQPYWTNDATRWHSKPFLVFPAGGIPVNGNDAGFMRTDLGWNLTAGNGYTCCGLMWVGTTTANTIYMASKANSQGPSITFQSVGTQIVFRTNILATVTGSYFFAAEYNQNTSFVRTNGALGKSANNPSYASTGISLNCSATSQTGSNPESQWAFIMFWNRRLTTGEAQQIEAWVSTNYFAF